MFYSTVECVLLHEKGGGISHLKLVDKYLNYLDFEIGLILSCIVS